MPISQDIAGRPRRSVRTAAIWLAIAVIALLGVRPVQAGDLETRVKAAYLYNFTKFVEWPNAVDPGAAQGPFTLAVLGPEQISSALASLQQKLVQGRPLQILQVDCDAPLPAVDMLYVATKDPDKAACMLSSIDTRPVLTIGESRNFIHAGGLINFYRKGKKIRFEINAQAARESGFKISSQLLKLARIVESEAP